MTPASYRAKTAADIRIKAEQVNQLVKEVSARSKTAAATVNDFAAATMKLDKELTTLIASLTSVDPASVGVLELRHLRTINGINTRVARGLAGNMGRIKDIQSNSLIIS